MPQNKRKDNPGKLDKRNPPLKTRLPVTGHPATGTTEASHQSPSNSHPSPPRHQPPSPNPTPPPPDDVAVLETLIPEVWGSLFQLRNLLSDRVDSIDKVDFHINGIFENVEIFGLTLGGGVFNMVREGAMRHEKILTTPPTTPQTDTGTQTTPPTTPPTPKPKPTTNSVSTTDPPPTRTYAEAATTTTSSSLRQQGQSACESDTTAVHAPPNQPKSTIHESTSRGTSRGSNKIQTRSDASLDRRRQQDSANLGNPLAFGGGQKDREAGVITGHLHDRDN